MKVKVTGSDIQITKDELIANGSKQCYEIEFKFDRDWNNMVNKTAVFYQPSVNRDDPIYKIIDDTNRITIPTSSLVANDFLYIGVFGFTADGKVRLPTVFTYTYVRQGCYRRDDGPKPDMSVYEEIYLMALKAFRTAMKVQEEADSGEFDGFSPTIVVKEDTSTSYILTITTKDGEFDTPNLVKEGSGDLTYIHHQDEAASEWEVVHNLKKYPSVTVVDSAKTKVYGDVTYVDKNSLIISFSSEFEGTAYLN